jgi:hypothetical protein
MPRTSAPDSANPRWRAPTPWARTQHLARLHPCCDEPSDTERWRETLARQATTARARKERESHFQTDARRLRKHRHGRRRKSGNGTRGSAPGASCTASVVRSQQDAALQQAANPSNDCVTSTPCWKREASRIERRDHTGCRWASGYSAWTFHRSGGPGIQLEAPVRQCATGAATGSFAAPFR